MYRFLGISLGNKGRVVSIEDDESPVVVPVSFRELTDPGEISRQIKFDVEEALGVAKKTYACVAMPDHVEEAERERVYKALNANGIKTFRVVTHSSAVGYAYGLENDQRSKILVMHVHDDSIALSILEAYGAFYSKAHARAENLNESEKHERVSGLIASVMEEADLAAVDLKEIIVTGEFPPSMEALIAEAVGRAPRIERDGERLIAFGVAILCERVGTTMM